MLETDARVALIGDWLARELRRPAARIEPASSDASFRRYFRVFCSGATYVVMDAPPDKEDVRPYLKVSRLLESPGAHVPDLHASDSEHGQLLPRAPGAFLHRDRHGRQLHVPEARHARVLCLPDGVGGPVGYDLVSLLKDCYIAWPRARVVEWVNGYRELLRSQGGPAGHSEQQFL